MKPIILLNLKFGRLLVTDRLPNARSGQTRWSARCDCGNTCEVWGISLRSGNTKSCGCLQKERARAAKTTHGKSYHPIYTIWDGMNERCDNPNCKSYKNYGGRGIFIAAEWAGNFEQFFADMSPTYVSGLTIERKDNDGPYSKDNCVWATAKEQQRNKRKSVFIQTPQGHMNLTTASELSGLSPDILAYRSRRGVGPEQIFSKPNSGRVFKI